MRRPYAAACLLESAEAGRPVTVRPLPPSGGLAIAEPSPLQPSIRDCACLRDPGRRVPRDLDTLGTGGQTRSSRPSGACGVAALMRDALPELAGARSACASAEASTRCGYNEAPDRTTPRPRSRPRGDARLGRASAALTSGHNRGHANPPWLEPAPPSPGKFHDSHRMPSTAPIPARSTSGRKGPPRQMTAATLTRRAELLWARCAALPTRLRREAAAPGLRKGARATACSPA